MVPPSGPPQTGNLWVELGGNGKGPGSRVRGLSWVAGNRAASCHLLTQRQDYRGVAPAQVPGTSSRPTPEHTIMAHCKHCGQWLKRVLNRRRFKRPKKLQS